MGPELQVMASVPSHLRAHEDPFAHESGLGQGPLLSDIADVGGCFHADDATGVKQLGEHALRLSSDPAASMLVRNRDAHVHGLGSRIGPVEVRVGTHVADGNPILDDEPTFKTPRLRVRIPVAPVLIRTRRVWPRSRVVDGTKFDHLWTLVAHEKAASPRMTAPTPMPMAMMSPGVLESTR